MIEMYRVIKFVESGRLSDLLEYISAKKKSTEFLFPTLSSENPDDMTLVAFDELEERLEDVIKFVETFADKFGFDESVDAHIKANIYMRVGLCMDLFIAYLKELNELGDLLRNEGISLEKKVRLGRGKITKQKQLSARNGIIRELASSKNSKLSVNERANRIYQDWDNPSFDLSEFKRLSVRQIRKILK